MNFNAHFIVKAIVREVIDTRRVVMEGDLRASSIMVDHDPKKLLCRLEIKGDQMKLILVDEHEHEEYLAISTVNDIYKYADRIKMAALRHASHW